MQKRLIGWGLKVPMLLLFLISLGASIYAAYNKISGITYASSVIFAVVLVLYILGEVILERNQKIIQK
jgi:hypothetical protein